MKNPDPMMGAKLKSKTHFTKHPLLNFWPFFAKKKGIKNAEFYADFKSIEKVFKMHTEKLQAKQI
jgi:hypothetical protein